MLTKSNILRNSIKKNIKIKDIKVRSLSSNVAKYMRKYNHTINNIKQYGSNKGQQ